jgi:hypothetical protein
MLLAGEDAEIAATVIEDGRASLRSDLGQPVDGSGEPPAAPHAPVDRLGLSISQTGAWAYPAFSAHCLAHLPTPDPATVSVSGCDKSCAGVHNTLK